MSSYAPEQGHIVWLDFNPQTGHEQAGRRPAIVLSRELYNRRSGLMVACPITSRVKGYPFEVTLPDGLAVSGVVLADHIKSLDWHRRNVSFVEAAPDATVEEVRQKVLALLR